ncbi:MAG: hypothetical protein DDG59_12520 [Anaerolineae bacterium]|jgi:DeoR/GlpR family transcriptional regulator of sugar metabolism|nr:MAG: hypothetical protein DDG59_12520 [Anaerolineae bacterium]
MNYRQKLILEKLAARDYMTIEALAQEFGVSKMTIHRDLAALQQAGFVLKQYGKVTAMPKRNSSWADQCQMCGQKIKEQNAFTLVSAEGNLYRLCCPHCGLMAYRQHGDSWQTLATDFLHGHVITAFQAHYLIDLELTICCSPTVLAFDSRAEALKFQKGFGGRVVDFYQAVEFINQNPIRSQIHGGSQ